MNKVVFVVVLLLTLFIHPVVAKGPNDLPPFTVEEVFLNNVWGWALITLPQSVIIGLLFPRKFLATWFFFSLWIMFTVLLLATSFTVSFSLLLFTLLLSSFLTMIAFLTSSIGEQVKKLQTIQSVLYRLPSFVRLMLPLAVYLLYGAVFVAVGSIIESRLPGYDPINYTISYSVFLLIIAFTSALAAIGIVLYMAYRKATSLPPMDLPNKRNAWYFFGIPFIVFIVTLAASTQIR